MEDRSGVITADPRRELRLVGAVIGSVIALIHLFHPQLGAPRVITYLELGVVYHPLPPVFVLSAMAIFFGIALVYFGVLVRPVYLLGILLMLAFVFGYVAWHTVFDHGAFWPHLEGAIHGESTLELLWLHVGQDPLGVVSKILELMLAAILAMLFLLDTPKR